MVKNSELNPQPIPYCGRHIPGGEQAYFYSEYAGNRPAWFPRDYYAVSRYINRNWYTESAARKYICGEEGVFCLDCAEKAGVEW